MSYDLHIKKIDPSYTESSKAHPALDSSTSRSSRCQFWDGLTMEENHGILPGKTRISATKKRFKQAEQMIENWGFTLIYKDSKRGAANTTLVHLFCEIASLSSHLSSF